MIWGGIVSESVAKAPRAGISREKKRVISTIILRLSGAMGAFATDLDKRRRRGPREGRPGPDGDRGGCPDRPGGPAGASVVVVTDHGADPAPEHFQ